MLKSSKKKSILTGGTVLLLAINFGAITAQNQPLIINRIQNVQAQQIKTMQADNIQSQIQPLQVRDTASLNNATIGNINTVWLLFPKRYNIPVENNLVQNESDPANTKTDVKNGKGWGFGNEDDRPSSTKAWHSGRKRSKFRIEKISYSLNRKMSFYFSRGKKSKADPTRCFAFK